MLCRNVYAGSGEMVQGVSACSGMSGPTSVLGWWVWQLSSNPRTQEAKTGYSQSKLPSQTSSGFDRDYVSENKVESDLEKVQKSVSGIQQNMHTSTYHI